MDNYESVIDVLKDVVLWNSLNLCGANLRGAALGGAYLSGAYLSEADLRGADLSGSEGIPTAETFLERFKRDSYGVIVYRVQKGEYTCPDNWSFEPGSVLTETPNPYRTVECGCGVSFATKEWCQKTYPNQAIYRCRIRWEWMWDVVVPFVTDGKARCAKLEILEVEK